MASQVLIRALGLTSSASVDSEHSKSVCKQIERYLAFDKLLPCHRSLVTAACIEALCDLQVCARIRNRHLGVDTCTNMWVGHWFVQCVRTLVRSMCDFFL